MFYVFSRKAVKKSLKFKIIRVWSRCEMVKKTTRWFLYLFREKKRENVLPETQTKKSNYDVPSVQGNPSATLVANTRELQRRNRGRLPQLLVIVAISNSVFNLDSLSIKWIWSFCMVGVFGSQPYYLFQLAGRKLIFFLIVVGS